MMLHSVINSEKEQIPATDENGHSYWPEWWTDLELTQNRAILGEDKWQSTWMQNVAPPEKEMTK
jgi:hypothetical protein